MVVFDLKNFMGKINKIKFKQNNTRIILFEKNLRYYHKTEIGELIFCLEKCMVHNRIMIGSSTCFECEHNIGNFKDHDFVICKKIKQAIGK